MFRTLLTLFNDADFQSRAREVFDELNGFVEPYVDNFSTFVDDVPSFVSEGDSYVLVLRVPDGLNGENIDVEIDEEENTLTVKTSYESKKVKYSREYLETLPSDADLDTLSARVSNGVLSVVVDKLPEPETEPETDAVDPTYVEIKRKKK